MVYSRVYNRIQHCERCNKRLGDLFHFDGFVSADADLKWLSRAQEPGCSILESVDGWFVPWPLLIILLYNTYKLSPICVCACFEIVLLRSTYEYIVMTPMNTTLCTPSYITICQTLWSNLGFWMHACFVTPIVPRLHGAWKLTMPWPNQNRSPY